MSTNDERTTEMSKRDRLAGLTERRHVAVREFELRESGGQLTFTGYASVFNSDYDVYGGPEMGGWTERVLPSAFRKTLKENPDVQLLINHGGMPLARTRSGTLQLSTDDTGLYTEASLDLRDPDVVSLRIKMDRGDMDQMSFAFRTIRDSWSEEETERDMVELSLDRGDVSIVNYGANPATSASLRGLADLDVEKALVEARSMDVQTLVEARDRINRLIREVGPKSVPQTLTLAEAQAML